MKRSILHFLAASLCLASLPDVVAAPRPSPFVNQAGYNLGEAKHFVLPGAPDGTKFQIIRLRDGSTVHEGVIRGQSGDFTAFDPTTVDDEYVVAVLDWGRSVPFWIADHLMERVSSKLAYEFFIDVRGGCSTRLSPRAVTGGGPSRDGGGQTLEATFDGLLYASNPALFDRWRGGLHWRSHGPRDALLLSIPLSEREPPERSVETVPPGKDQGASDLIKLMIWHAEWAYNNMDYDGPTSLGFESSTDGYRHVRQFGYDDQHLQDFDRQNLLDQLAAAHAFYRPFLHRYIPAEQHEAMRQAALERWTRYDRQKEVRYWVKSYKWIDEGRLEFNEQGSAFGQGLLRNLLMYLGEKAEPDGGESKQFAEYARQCAEDIVKNWNFDNPVHMWRARNAEHITPQALALLVLMAPEIAPPGAREKLAAWRDYIVKRTDNLWHYRTHSDTEWAHPRSKEVGTVAGLGGSMFAVAEVLGDRRLRALGWSQVDYVFGANPAGAHLGRNSAARVALGGFWDGVEHGWTIAFTFGTGGLLYTRGALDGSPTNDAFPFNPESAALSDKPDVYATEGWAISNRAWLSTVAFATIGSQSVRWTTPDGEPLSEARAGAPVRIELRAALNLDPRQVEKGSVLLETAGDAPRFVEVSETGPNTGVFVAKLSAVRGAMTASYGYLAFRKAARLLVDGPRT